VADLDHAHLKRSQDKARENPRFERGASVSVIVNERNRTPHQGTIRKRVWHYKFERWTYFLEEEGRKVSKRYIAEDLEPTPGSRDHVASDDWCSIYVTRTKDGPALVRVVASATRGRVDPAGLITSFEGVEIEVGTNSSNPGFERVRPDETDFTYWPWVIDLEVDEERGVPLVAAILRELWSHDLWAVAACSFEEKLPRSGGYRDGQLILADE